MEELFTPPDSLESWGVEGEGEILAGGAGGDGGAAAFWDLLGEKIWRIQHNFSSSHRLNSYMIVSFTFTFR